MIEVLTNMFNMFKNNTNNQGQTIGGSFCAEEIGLFDLQLLEQFDTGDVVQVD